MNRPEPQFIDWNNDGYDEIISFSPEGNVLKIQPYYNRNGRLVLGDAKQEIITGINGLIPMSIIISDWDLDGFKDVLLPFQSINHRHNQHHQRHLRHPHHQHHQHHQLRQRHQHHHYQHTCIISIASSSNPNITSSTIKTISINTTISTITTSGTISTICITSTCLLYTSPSPRDRTRYRMPSSA